MTFIGLFVVGVVISTQVARARERAEVMRTREVQTASLYYLSRDLAASADITAVLKAVVRNVEEALKAQVVILLPEGERLDILAASDGLVLDIKEQAVADWAFRNSHPAGRATDTLVSADLIYLPLQTTASVLGVMGGQTGERADYHSRRAAACWTPLPPRQPWPWSGSSSPARPNRPRFSRHGKIWNGPCSTPFPTICVLRWFP